MVNKNIPVLETVNPRRELTNTPISKACRWSIVRLMYLQALYVFRHVTQIV